MVFDLRCRVTNAQLLAENPCLEGELEVGTVYDKEQLFVRRPGDDEWHVVNVRDLEVLCASEELRAKAPKDERSPESAAANAVWAAHWANMEALRQPDRDARIVAHLQRALHEVKAYGTMPWGRGGTVEHAIVAAMKGVLGPSFDTTRLGALGNTEEA